MQSDRYKQIEKKTQDFGPPIKKTTKTKEKIIYTCFVADYWHPGHQNILNECKKLGGKIIVGLMSDKSALSYKRLPSLNYSQRRSLVEDKKGIWKVVTQHELDYRPNLDKYLSNPKYIPIVVNGDDWAVRGCTQWQTRQQVIEWLNEHNGKLFEVPYTKGISSTLIIEDKQGHGITPEYRLGLLRRLINITSPVRVLEAHNGLSAEIVENTSVDGKKFHALWDSSLCSSASRGKPDIEMVDLTDRLHTIQDMISACSLPIVMDVDTGGQIQNFSYTVKTLERLGVSALIVEDKVFPKINSLMPNAKHIQETIPNFCAKIKAGKEAQITENFMIIARIESLILGKSLKDAIQRAIRYTHAGADAIMIHSKSKSPEEILKFCKIYNGLEYAVPIVVVPTTYNKITEKELTSAGVSVIIYANAMLRASYKSMKEVAEYILKYERLYESEKKICTTKELFDLTNPHG